MKTSYSLSKVAEMSLTNAGQLEVLCLGAGSMLSWKANTAFLIVKGQDHLLYDCGDTVPLALHGFGIDIAKIRNVVLSHAHEDHINGFGKICRMVRHYSPLPAKGERPTLVNLIAERSFAENLWVHSFGGLAIDDAPAHWSSRPENSYNVVQTRQGSFDGRDVHEINVGGIKVQLFRTMHTPASATGWSNSAWSTGILIDGKVWISGDCRFDRDLIRSYETMPSIELFIHDAATAFNPVHASLLPHELPSLRLEVKSRTFLAHCDDKMTVELAKRWAFRGVLEQGSKFTFN